MQIYVGKLRKRATTYMFKKNSSSAVLIVKNAILHREYSIFHIFMYEIRILTLSNPQFESTSFTDQHPQL
jgi:hypothetical protein